MRQRNVSSSTCLKNSITTYETGPYDRHHNFHVRPAQQHSGRTDDVCCCAGRTVLTGVEHTRRSKAPIRKPRPEGRGFQIGASRQGVSGAHLQWSPQIVGAPRGRPPIRRDTRSPVK